MGNRAMLPLNVRLIVAGLCTGISFSVLAQQADKPTIAVSTKAPYAVEDLVLGDKLDSDTLTRHAYRCSRSEQFVGFTWCTNRSSRSRGYTAYSILHSPDDKIVYANKTLEPAFSSAAEAKDELQRISQKLGAQPKIIDMPHRSGLPDGMIAVWGNVVLTPVDADNIKKLAEGRSPKLGFMVDFVADFERSAKKGLPVYKIGGGPGLVLAVSYGKPDQGTLRLIAVDASKFASPAIDQAQPPVAAQPPPIQQVAIAAQSPPTSNQTAIAAQPPLQPTSTSNELQTNLTELKKTISSLKADLAKATAKISKLETQNVETERQLKQEAQARLAAEDTNRQAERTLLEKQNAAQSTGYVTRFLAILISMSIGALLALMAVRSPTLWNLRNKLNLASKLPNNLTVWATRVQGRYHPKELFERELDKHVAEINVTAQPREVN